MDPMTWRITEWNVKQSCLPDELFREGGTLSMRDIESIDRSVLSWDDRSGRPCELVFLGKIPDELHVKDSAITVDGGVSSIQLKWARIEVRVEAGKRSLYGRLEGKGHHSGEPGTIAAVADDPYPASGTEPA